jgi:hypothetical protein
MNALRAEVARLQELVAVKDQQLLASKDAQLSLKDQLLTSKEAQLAMKDKLLASRTEETKRLKRELQLRDASLNASAGELWEGSSKRQRVHDSSSSSSSSSCGCFAESPLDKDELLDQVFSYVGGGDHLYVAGVSRRWRGRYMQYCVLNSTCEADKKFVTTLCSTIMSESRLQLAVTCGLSIEDLTVNKWYYAELVCGHSTAPEQVLTLLRLHGVPWDADLCTSAALHAKLPLLQ